MFGATSRAFRSASALAWLFIAATAVGQQPLHVPRGKPVLLDGKIAAEWDDAISMKLSDLATLYVKQSEEYLWLALKLSAPDGAVDLYLSPTDGAIYDLHSSAKLGERRLVDGAWPDWRWWNNGGWVANVSRVDSFEKRTFLPTGVREFQIRKSRFLGSQWKIMVELLTPAEPEWRATPYPAACINSNTKGWIVLDLDKTK